MNKTKSKICQNTKKLKTQANTKKKNLTTVFCSIGLSSPSILSPMAIANHAIQHSKHDTNNLNMPKIFLPLYK